MGNNTNDQSFQNNLFHISYINECKLQETNPFMEGWKSSTHLKTNVQKHELSLVIFILLVIVILCCSHILLSHFTKQFQC